MFHLESPADSSFADSAQLSKERPALLAQALKVRAIP
jgi:hypothetical protein